LASWVLEDYKNQKSLGKLVFNFNITINILIFVIKKILKLTKIKEKNTWITFTNVGIQTHFVI